MTRDDVRPERELDATTGRALWMFFGIAYAITWLLQLPVALSDDGLGWLSYSATETGLYFLLVGLSTFGPTVAALVTLRATAGPGAIRDLLRRCILWRVPVRWYLVAILGVLLLPVVAAFLVPGTAEQFTLSVETVLILVVLLVTFQLAIGALGEEPGWRGFALPRLQHRFGPLGGSVILGVLWGGWHAPLFVVADWVDTKGGTTVWTAVQYLLFTVALSILMAWVFNNTRGSVLLIILFHSAVNTALGGVREMFPDSDVADHRVLLPGVIGFGIAALVVVAATRGRLGYGNPGPVDRRVDLAGER